MNGIQAVLRQGRHRLRRWALNPSVHIWLRLAAHFLSGFGLSAASLGNTPQPLVLGLLCACSDWSAVAVAAGGSIGYLVFWAGAGQQGLLWMLGGLAAALLVGESRIGGRTPFLLSALSGLIVSSSGVVFQTWMHDTTTVPIYLLRVALGAASTELFLRVIRGRNPVLEWLTYGVAVLALAQIVPLPNLSLGFVAAGALAVGSAFPAVAMAGLALDLAQITPVSMTAVLCGSFLFRFLPKYPPKLSVCMPAVVYIIVSALHGSYDFSPLTGLLVGGVVGIFLPPATKVAHRRGETGAAQVRLEMAAGVLSQTEQILLEAPEIPVDEDALVVRAAERACAACPCRKNCKDSRRIGQLPGLLLHKSLLTPDELPIICRKSGRFLAELHRSQEHLRCIQADRERQREYRVAVLQQYQFLGEYLQDLSDQLARKTAEQQPYYQPQVQIFANRPEAENGDRCLMFSGPGLRYYVLLCDGMGTGIGAVHEGKTAAQMLKRLLTAGYPAEHALRSLNSLCALRDRAGAVTVDLAELHLDTGKAIMYKWGAAPSYLVTPIGAEKVGFAGAPPGLSVTDHREMTEKLSLRRAEMLVLVSDGVGQDETLQCCREQTARDARALATAILECAEQSGQDDATVVMITLTANTEKNN